MQNLTPMLCMYLELSSSLLFLLSCMLKKISVMVSAQIAHGILASHNRSIMGTGGTPVPSVNVDGTSVLKQLHSLLHSSDNAQSPGIEELQRHQSTREVEASDAASYGVQTLHGIQHHVKTPGTLRAADDIESHKRAGASTTGLQVMVKLHGVQKVTEELVTCQKKFNAVSIDNEWSQTSKARADLSNLFVQVRPLTQLSGTRQYECILDMIIAHIRNTKQLYVLHRPHSGMP